MQNCLVESQAFHIVIFRCVYLSGGVGKDPNNTHKKEKMEENGVKKNICANQTGEVKKFHVQKNGITKIVTLIRLISIGSFQKNMGNN